MRPNSRDPHCDSLSQDVEDHCKSVGSRRPCTSGDLRGVVARLCRAVHTACEGPAHPLEGDLRGGFLGLQAASLREAHPGSERRHWALLSLQNARERAGFGR